MMLAAPATRRFSSLGFQDVFGPQSTTTWNFWRRSWRMAVGWWQAVVARPQLLRCGSRWACSSSDDEMNKTCSPENDKAEEGGSSVAVICFAGDENFFVKDWVGGLFHGIRKEHNPTPTTHATLLALFSFKKKKQK